MWNRSQVYKKTLPCSKWESINMWLLQPTSTAGSMSWSWWCSARSRTWSTGRGSRCSPCRRSSRAAGWTAGRAGRTGNGQKNTWIERFEVTVNFSTSSFFSSPQLLLSKYNYSGRGEPNWPNSYSKRKTRQASPVSSKPSLANSTSESNTHLFDLRFFLP